MTIVNAAEVHSIKKKLKMERTIRYSEKEFLKLLVCAIAHGMDSGSLVEIITERLISDSGVRHLGVKLDV